MGACMSRPSAPTLPQPKDVHQLGAEETHEHARSAPESRMHSTVSSSPFAAVQQEHVHTGSLSATCAHQQHRSRRSHEHEAAHPQPTSSHTQQQPASQEVQELRAIAASLAQSVQQLTGGAHTQLTGGTHGTVRKRGSSRTGEVGAHQLSRHSNDLMPEQVELPGSLSTPKGVGGKLGSKSGRQVVGVGSGGSKKGKVWEAEGEGVNQEVTGNEEAAALRAEVQELHARMRAMEAQLVEFNRMKEDWEAQRAAQEFSKQIRKLEEVGIPISGGSRGGSLPKASASNSVASSLAMSLAEELPSLEGLPHNRYPKQPYPPPGPIGRAPLRRSRAASETSQSGSGLPSVTASADRFAPPSATSGNPPKTPAKHKRVASGGATAGLIGTPKKSHPQAPSPTPSHLQRNQSMPYPSPCPSPTPTDSSLIPAPNQQLQQPQRRKKQPQHRNPHPTALDHHQQQQQQHQHQQQEQQQGGLNAHWATGLPGSTSTSNRQHRSLKPVQESPEGMSPRVSPNEAAAGGHSVDVQGQSLAQLAAHSSRQAAATQGRGGGVHVQGSSVGAQGGEGGHRLVGGQRGGGNYEGVAQAQGSSGAQSGEQEGGEEGEEEGSVVEHCSRGSSFARVSLGQARGVPWAGRRTCAKEGDRLIRDAAKPTAIEL